MFNKILISNRGDQLRSNLAAKPNCMPTHIVRAGEFDTEAQHV